MGEGALGPLETLVALREIWHGQVGERNHAGGPREGMAQELVMVVRKATWRGGNPGISHSRKTLVTHPWSWRARGITPEHQNEGCREWGPRKRPNPELGDTLASYTPIPVHPPPC